MSNFSCGLTKSAASPSCVEDRDTKNCLAPSFSDSELDTDTISWSDVGIEGSLAIREETNQLLEYWELFTEVDVMFPGVRLRLADDPPVSHEDVINLPVLQ